MFVHSAALFQHPARDVYSREASQESRVQRKETIPLTKRTAAQNEVALSCHRARGLYLPAVIFGLQVFQNNIFGDIRCDPNLNEGFSILIEAK